MSKEIMSAEDLAEKNAVCDKLISPLDEAKVEVAKTRKRIHVTLIGGGTLLFSIGGALFQYSIEADGGPQNPMPDWTLPLLAGAIGAMLGLIAAQDFSDRAEDRIVNMMLKKLKKITTEAQAALSKTILED